MTWHQSSLVVVWLAQMAGAPASAANAFTVRVGLETLGHDALVEPEGERCNVCHTPHGGAGDGPPLWNRTNNDRTYRMYASVRNDLGGSPQPAPVSLACLSCHDGTVANDRARDPASTLGTDLSDDHPISIAYDPVRDRGLVALEHVERAGLPLYPGGTRQGPGQVECSTCHALHGEKEAALLRQGSPQGLCASCHVK